VDLLPEEDRSHGWAVIQGLETRQNLARQRLTEALQTDRLGALIGRLIDGAEAPPFLDDAAKPADEIIPQLVVHPWKRLRDAAEAIKSGASDEGLHEARILAKRVRYALEATEPVLDKSARQHAKALARLQAALGDLHDTVVSRALLRAIVADYVNPAAAAAVGQIVGYEMARHEHLCQQWRGLWKDASKKPLRAWMP
jgi:CHAD domain-containing protein